ncbi:MAG: phytanoyl-CoA dioxygenase family protein [Fimbriimonas sp.]
MSAIPNGHNVKRAVGDTMYRGEVQNLPYPAEFDLERAIVGMHEDGYCIFPGVLAAEKVAWLRAKMDSMGGPDEQYDVPNWTFNKHLSSNYHRDPEMLQMMDQPDVIDVCESIFGEHFHVIGGSLWVTGTGRGMGIHVDFLPFPQASEVPAAVTIPIFMATAHYYLDDLTLDLGPTTIIPGSHRAARYPENESTWHDVPPHAVMLKAGDACLFRSDLWHGAAMNTSDRRRYMIQVHYAHSAIGKWYPSLTYEELYAPEVLATATERQRVLLGDPKLP